MFKLLTLQERLIKEEKKNEGLLSVLEQKCADIEYIAMMCDVDIEEGQND